MNRPEAGGALDATIDAYDIATGESEYSRWLSALMCAIQSDIKRNEGRKAADLAQLGQYIADECLEYLGREAEQLKGRVEAQGAQQ